MLEVHLEPGRPPAWQLQHAIRRPKRRGQLVALGSVDAAVAAILDVATAHYEPNLRVAPGRYLDVLDQQQCLVPELAEVHGNGVGAEGGPPTAVALEIDLVDRHARGLERARDR